jgi:hypothetical protein
MEESSALDGLGAHADLGAAGVEPAAGRGYGRGCDRRISQTVDGYSVRKRTAEPPVGATTQVSTTSSSNLRAAGCGHCQRFSLGTFLGVRGIAVERHRALLATAHRCIQRRARRCILNFLRELRRGPSCRRRRHRSLQRHLPLRLKGLVADLLCTPLHTLRRPARTSS